MQLTQHSTVSQGLSRVCVGHKLTTHRRFNGPIFAIRSGPIPDSPQQAHQRAGPTRQLHVARVPSRLPPNRVKPPVDGIDGGDPIPSPSPKHIPSPSNPNTAAAILYLPSLQPYPPPNHSLTSWTHTPRSSPLRAGYKTRHVSPHPLPMPPSRARPRQQSPCMTHR